MGVTIHVEDGHLVCTRTIKENLLSYTGETIKNKDLSKPKLTKFMIKFNQKKYSTKDKNKNCEIYPTNLYQSYKECDKAFVFDTIKDYYHFTPIWAAKDLRDVTKKTIFNSSESLSMPVNYEDLFDGTVVSPCPLPCTSTQISGAQISTRYISANYSTFDLTFSQMVTINISEYPSFDWTMFLSELGGAMGLWFGLGVAQFVGSVSFYCLKCYS